VLALGVIGAIIAVVLASSGGGGSKKKSTSASTTPAAPAGKPFKATDQAVPANHVTGSGSGSLTLSGNTITVSVDTNGLLNGAPHAMHIHAGRKGICPPASAARIHNGHLSISTTDGIPFYGPPQVALTSTGDTSKASIIDFSRFPSVGDIRYKRTFAIPPGIAGAIKANKAVLIVHGIDYNGNGIYDNVLDRSELKRSLPGEATAPALCGRFLAAQTASADGARTSGGARTYAIVWQRTVAATVAAPQSGGFYWLCHLPLAGALKEGDNRTTDYALI
jgi:hypothetical protein